MRTALIAAFVLAGLTAAVEHHCIHDTAAMQEEVARALAAPPERTAGRTFHPQATFEAMRISLSTTDIAAASTSQFCTAAGQARPNFAGSTITCTADDVFDATKRSTLTTQVLPPAQTRLQKALKVRPLASNLVVTTGCSNGITLPTAHTTTGVASTDYVLYVSAGQTSGSTLAWARGCSRLGDSDPKKNRFVTGVANFGPKYITTTGVTGQVATAVHEMLHALGFSGTALKAFVTSKTTTLRGTSVELITSPKAVAAYRSLIGCDSLEGPELEGEGGSGSRGSHWDRRVLKDEMMAASGGTLLSDLTLSVLEDTGHYEAVRTEADSIGFGRNAGCGFVTSKCNTAAAGNDKWWCFNKATTGCTVDGVASGYCNVDSGRSLAAAFQYFGNSSTGGPLFLDGCPYIQGYSNGQCTDETQNTGTKYDLGHNYGAGGKCFNTDGVVKIGLSLLGGTGSSPARCMQATCSSKYISFQVGKTSRTFTCPKAGAKVGFLVAFDGTVTCPDHEVVCAGVTTAPSITTRDDGEVKGELTFSGATWSIILLNFESAVSLAISQDLAVIFGVGMEAVHLSAFVNNGNAGMTVSYRLNRGDTTPGSVQTELDKLVAQPNITSTLPATAAVYTAQGGTGTVKLTSATAEHAFNLCGRPDWGGKRIEVEDSVCYGILGAIGLVIIILVALLIFCLYRCCCAGKDEVKKERRRRRPNSAEPTSPNGPAPHHPHHRA